jgi:hypothetical protein
MTTEQIKEWLIAKREECAKIAPCQPVSFSASADNFGSQSRVLFRAYGESVGHGKECADPKDAIESFRIISGAFTPEEKAAKFRKQAAKLIASAEELEAQN